MIHDKIITVIKYILVIIAFIMTILCILAILPNYTIILAYLFLVLGIRIDLAKKRQLYVISKFNMNNNIGWEGKLTFSYNKWSLNLIYYIICKLDRNYDYLIEDYKLFPRKQREELINDYFSNQD